MQNIDLVKISSPKSREDIHIDCLGVSFGVAEMSINEDQFQSNVENTTVEALHKLNKKYRRPVREANSFGKSFPVYYRRLAFSGEAKKDIPFYNWHTPVGGFVNSKI